ncbi:MAG: DUF2339 domain-containing protein [Myxococcota bacterium]
MAAADAASGDVEPLASALEPLLPPEPVPEPEAPPPKQTLEEAIGLVWITRIGAALLVVGVIYFFQLAIERGWLGPWGRVGVGLAFGGGAVALAALLKQKTSPAWVAVLVGLGLAIALGAVWAAHALYHLVPGLVAFGAVTALVGGAAALAAVWRMEAILGTAVTSAFVNLGALSDGLPGHAALVGYALVVGGGCLLVAVPRRWTVVAVAVGPGAAAAYATRHFGLVGAPLGAAGAVDAAVAIALALALGAMLVWGARRMPEAIAALMHGGAALTAAGVATTLSPLAGFGVLAAAIGYRGYEVARGGARDPVLHTGVFVIGLLGLAAAGAPWPLAIWAVLGVGSAALGGDGPEIATAGVAIAIAALGVDRALPAAGGAGAAVLAAAWLAARRSLVDGLTAAVALGLVAVALIVGRTSPTLAAMAIGGLALLSGAVAGALARHAPAFMAMALALVSLAFAIDAERPWLGVFGGSALAALPLLARRSELPTRPAMACRALGLVTLAVAALASAGQAFDDAGARTVAQTLALGAFGALVVAWGFVRKAVLDRWVGLAALGAAILKLVLWDVFALDTVPRTLILVAFGVLLLSSGFLYARTVTRRR